MDPLLLWLQVCPARRRPAMQVPSCSLCSPAPSRHIISCQLIDIYLTCTGPRYMAACPAARSWQVQLQQVYRVLQPCQSTNEWWGREEGGPLCTWELPQLSALVAQVPFLQGQQVHPGAQEGRPSRVQVPCVLLEEVSHAC